MLWGVYPIEYTRTLGLEEPVASLSRTAAGADGIVDCPSVRWPVVLTRLQQQFQPLLQRQIVGHAVEVARLAH